MYIVTELQTNVDGTVGILNSTFADREQAESTYHSILASAAISALPCHAAVMYSEEGFPLLHQAYRHASED